MTTETLIGENLEYEVLPDLLLTQPKFLEHIASIGDPQECTDAVNGKTGKALYDFIVQCQSMRFINGQPVEEDMQNATDNLFSRLAEIQREAFEDFAPDANAMILSLPIQSPFAIVYGRAVIILEALDVKERISVDWIVQNVVDPMGGYLPMGKMLQIGVSQEIEDANPGLMEKVSLGQVGLDEIIQIVKDSLPKAS